VALSPTVLVIRASQEGLTMPRRAETVLTVIVLIALPTVMYGGYSLLTLQGSGSLTEFQTTYFRAGHAHA
jgi:hypothetical protein